MFPTEQGLLSPAWGQGCCGETSVRGQEPPRAGDLWGFRVRGAGSQGFLTPPSAAALSAAAKEKVEA